MHTSRMCALFSFEVGHATYHMYVCDGAMLCILAFGMYVCIIISVPSNIYSIESARFTIILPFMYLYCFFFFPAAIVCGFETPSVMVKEKDGFVTKSISCNRPAPSDFTLRVRTFSGTALGTYPAYIPDTMCMYVLMFI